MKRELVFSPGATVIMHDEALFHDCYADISGGFELAFGVWVLGLFYLGIAAVGYT